MIEDKAKELGRLVGQSSEYKEVKRASDALNEDKETVALLQKMEQLRVNAQRMLAQGQRPTEEMERELDTLLSQVQATREGVLTSDAIADERFASSHSIIALGVRSAMAVPLLSAIASMARCDSEPLPIEP